MKEDKLRDELDQIKKAAFEVGFHSGWKAACSFQLGNHPGFPDAFPDAPFRKSYAGYAREENELFAHREAMRIRRIFE